MTDVRTRKGRRKRKETKSKIDLKLKGVESLHVLCFEMMLTGRAGSKRLGSENQVFSSLNSM